MTSFWIFNIPLNGAETYCNCGWNIHQVSYLHYQMLPTQSKSIPIMPSSHLKFQKKMMRCRICWILLSPSKHLILWHHLLQGGNAPNSTTIHKPYNGSNPLSHSYVGILITVGHYRCRDALIPRQNSQNMCGRYQKEEIHLKTILYF